MFITVNANKGLKRMNLDIQSIYADYGIATADEGDKHHRDGWVQTPCPFCTGNEGYHLGFNLEYNYFNCWRCGHKQTEKALGKILNLSYKNVRKILGKYKVRGKGKFKHKTEIKIKKRAFRFPTTKPILRHKYSLDYMLERGYTKKNIKQLAKDFGIKCTGSMCHFKFDKKAMNLKFRIIAPIFWQSDIVSWQTRDCTKKAKLKYIACPMSVEKIHHKHILYTRKDLDLKTVKSIILVEGIFDVWKLYLAGYDAIAGFGVELKTEQILLLKKIPKLYIWLDPDKAGERKGKEILTRLAFAGCNVEQITGFKKDPGDLTINQIKRGLKSYD